VAGDVEAKPKAPIQSGIGPGRRRTNPVGNKGVMIVKWPVVEAEHPLEDFLIYDMGT